MAAGSVFQLADKNTTGDVNVVPVLAAASGVLEAAPSGEQEGGEARPAPQNGNAVRLPAPPNANAPVPAPANGVQAIAEQY